MTVRCSERVYDSQGFGDYLCSRPVAKDKDGQPVLEGGKPYCSIHLPSVVARRRVERGAKWRQKWEGWLEERRRQAACLVACKGVSTEDLEQGNYVILKKEETTNDSAH